MNLKKHIFFPPKITEGSFYYRYEESNKPGLFKKEFFFQDYLRWFILL